MKVERDSASCSEKGKPDLALWSLCFQNMLLSPGRQLSKLTLWQPGKLQYHSTPKFCAYQFQLLTVTNPGFPWSLYTKETSQAQEREGLN